MIEFIILYFFSVIGFMQTMGFISEIIKVGASRNKKLDANVYGSMTMSGNDLITLLEREKAKQERVKRGQISEVKNMLPPPERPPLRDPATYVERV